ncbi:MAG: response regulator [Acidobacteriia bacterium]|nr:response regulator [Terriglobia bacterium]
MHFASKTQKFLAEEIQFSVKVILDVRKVTRSLRFRPPSVGLDLARVLLVHGELAPRLALSTILQASGYKVDVAASTAEALAKLDDGIYDLVLADQEFGKDRSGLDLLAYARVKGYRPATAFITSHHRRHGPRGELHSMGFRRFQHQNISIYTENLPQLLERVAELIGVRASRRYRPLRQAV